MAACMHAGLFDQSLPPELGSMRRSVGSPHLLAQRPAMLASAAEKCQCSPRLPFSRFHPNNCLEDCLFEMRANLHQNGTPTCAVLVLA
jgi:hypothetical protein